MKKIWLVKYDHEDGRKGEVKVTTETEKSKCFKYGNGLAGRVSMEDGFVHTYDLRYCSGTESKLHTRMLEDVFGNGLVSARLMEGEQE